MKLKVKMQHLRNQLNKTCYVAKKFLRIRLTFANVLWIHLVGVARRSNLKSYYLQLLVSVVFLAARIS